MSDFSEPRGPNKVDLHVGARLRMRRKLIGASQESLADALGLTFQQVLKYERGANRVSASKLYEAAKFLGVTVEFFFDGLPSTDASAADHNRDAAHVGLITDFLSTSEGLELAELFPRLGNARIRRSIVAMCRSLSLVGDGADKDS